MLGDGWFATDNEDGEWSVVHRIFGEDEDTFTYLGSADTPSKWDALLARAKKKVAGSSKKDDGPLTEAAARKAIKDRFPKSKRAPSNDWSVEAHALGHGWFATDNEVGDWSVMRRIFTSDEDVFEMLGTAGTPAKWRTLLNLAKKKVDEGPTRFEITEYAKGGKTRTVTLQAFVDENDAAPWIAGQIVKLKPNEATLLGGGGIEMTGVKRLQRTPNPIIRQPAASKFTSAELVEKRIRRGEVLSQPGWTVGPYRTATGGSTYAVYRDGHGVVFKGTAKAVASYAVKRAKATGYRVSNPGWGKQLDGSTINGFKAYWDYPGVLKLVGADGTVVLATPDESTYTPLHGDVVG